MNNDGGYTRSYRRKWDNPVFANKAQAAVWAWMCDVAQYQDHTLRTKFGPVELHPGELVISERELSDDFNLHRNTVRLLLNRMVDAGMISLNRDRTPHRVGTIVTILKYVEYQGFNGNTYDAKDRKTDTTRTEEGPKRDQEQVSKYTEEDSVEPCVSLESPPCAPVREAGHPQAPPVSSETKSSNIVPLKPALAVMPDDWVLSPEWYRAAIDLGWHDPEGSAGRFAKHWLGKKDRGDRDAANSEAGWLREWTGWIKGDIKREREHGKQLGGGQWKKSGNGLVAYAHAEDRRNPGFAQADPDDGDWRELRG